MSGPSLSGVLFLAQQDSMRELVGVDAYERGLSTLDPEVREQVRSAAVVGWIPFTVVEATMSAVASEAERPLESFQRELSQMTVARTLRGVWRVLVRLATLDALVTRMAMFWSKSYDRGSLRLVRSDPDLGMEIELENFPGASDFVLRGVGYGFESMLHHAGARAVQVRWRRAENGATYTVKWRRAT